MINCSGLEATPGLAGPGAGGKGSRGLAAHAGVAFSEGGCALGVFSLDADFRAVRKEDAVKGAESARWTDAFAKAAELAAACPRTRVVSVCDREGDMWNLLSKGCASAAEDGGTEYLFTLTAGLPAATRRRRSPGSPSTPPASPDSSRRSASPCRAHESCGKDI